LAGQLATSAATGVIVNDDFASTSANQTLTGTDASDVFLLGGGLDSVVAKAGLDLFRFLPTAIGPASGNAAALRDFSHVAGEVMDLSAIDAIAGTLADDAFNFIGTAAFTAAGQLRWQDQGTLRPIQGEVNRDGIADLTIIVKAPGPIDSTWFAL
jgi:serralysin